MSIKGYDKVGAAVVSGRALEARALTRCALALHNAVNSGDEIALIEAIRMNNKLWLFFYSEIESGNVVLPTEVANNIVSLVAYVVKVAPRACAGERKVIDTLISINRNIAAGLSEGGQDAADAVPAASQPQRSVLSASV